jgi:hypothetical protein
VSSKLHLSLILLWLLLGIITAYFAQQRGRNPQIWFFIGMVFGLLGLAFLFLLPTYPQEPELETPASSTASNSNPNIEQIIPSNYQNITWYYLDPERKQIGPVSFETIQNLYRQGDLITSSYVWCEGMQEWRKIVELQPFHIL